MTPTPQVHFVCPLNDGNYRRPLNVTKSLVIKVTNSKIFFYFIILISSTSCVQTKSRSEFFFYKNSSAYWWTCSHVFVERDITLSDVTLDTADGNITYYYLGKAHEMDSSNGHSFPPPSYIFIFVSILSKSILFKLIKIYFSTCIHFDAT